MRVACIWFESSAPVQTIAELFLRFSPQICIINDKAIFVEIGKCQKLYEEGEFLNQTMELLKLANKKTEITFGLDITDSLIMAKYRVRTIEEAPLLALIEFSDPFYKDEALRKGVLKLIKSFQDLGIINLKQFKQIPVGDLISRFGIVGRFVYQRVHMTDFLSWPLWKPDEVIEEAKEFAYFDFYGELDPIIFELKSHLDLIFERLFSRAKRLMKLRVQIKCEKLSTNPNFLRTFDFEFFAPQSAVKGTLRIIRERLGREFEKKPVLSPIEGIKTTVLRTVPFNGGQKNIFNNDEEKTEQLYSTHNQLSELLGKENVYQVELTEDRRPERSWKKRYDSPHHPSDKNEDFVQMLPTRVPVLCDRPVKIEVTAGFVHINKRKYKIKTWSKQIEKIVGGWSEKSQENLKDVYHRTYSIVTLEDGRWLSVFQTLEREFFLHGYSA